MKKYFCLIVFCLIYYWWIELIVLFVVGVGIGIYNYERRVKQTYNTLPGVTTIDGEDRSIMSDGKQCLIWYDKIIFDDSE